MGRDVELVERTARLVVAGDDAAGRGAGDVVASGHFRAVQIGHESVVVFHLQDELIEILRRVERERHAHQGR